MDLRGALPRPPLPTCVHARAPPRAARAWGREVAPLLQSLLAAGCRVEVVAGGEVPAVRLLVRHHSRQVSLADLATHLPSIQYTGCLTILDT